MTKELDYSKVIAVGNGWGVRDESGKIKLFATAQEAAGGEPPARPKLKPAPAKPAVGSADLNAANERAVKAEAELAAAIENASNAQTELDTVKAELVSAGELIDELNKELEALRQQPTVEKFDVFKVVDGKRAERASKHNLSKADADQFVADNPDNTYEIVADEK